MPRTAAAGSPSPLARFSKQWIRWGLLLGAGLAVAVGCSNNDSNGVAPDYSLSLSDATLSIAPGGNSNTVVTITRTNFAGSVALSLGGAPAGVTGSFNPPTPTGNTSTLTVSVGAAVVPGIYNLTVDGTGTAGDKSTPLTLTVTAAPDYALSLTSAALSIVQGANGNTDVTITRTNFTGAVTLSLGGAPAGVTGVFAPAAPTGTASTLTVTVGASVAAGVYNLTVDGTGAAGNHSTPLTLTVTALPADYTLSLAPAAFSVAPGASGPTTVTITRTNFTGAVTLSLGGAPAGITGAFVPAAPTGTTSTLTVTVGAAVTAGVYNLTVDGTGTAGNKSTPLTLTVTAAPDYALSLNPAALSIVQGASTPTTVVTITRTNFTGAVTLSLGGAPAGVTGAFAPAAPTGTTSTLTVTVGAAVTPGVYNLTVDGTGTAGDKSTPLTLTVTATPNYALSLNPAALSIVQGASTPTTAVTITRTNFTGAVTLSLGGAPAGVTGVFAPAAPTGTTSTLTVTVGAAVAPGVYNLTVDGAATGPGAKTTPLTLTVTAAPANYALSLNPAALSIVQGASTPTTAVTITRTNFTGAVTLSLGGAPAGVTGAFAPAAPTGTTSTLTVTVGIAVAPGVYNLTVDGAATGPGAKSTPLTLTVTAAAADYSLSLNPAALSIAQGASTPTTAVTITRTNFTGAVTLSLGGAPAGVTGAFAPAAPTGTASTLTVTVGPAVAVGVYNLTVDGTGTPGGRSTPLTLTVEAASGSGNVTVDFSACTAGEQAVWLAFQDGAGAWTAVTPVANVYNFNIATARGGYAYVVSAAGNSEINVQYQTQAQLTANPIVFCAAVPTGKTINGLVAGLAATDMVSVSLGGGAASPSFATLNFQLTGVASGNQDLLAFRRDLLGINPSAVIIRRDVDTPDMGSLATLDFGTGEAFAPATATITLAGLLGGENVSQSMFYQTGASCTAGSLYFGGTGGATFTASGIPGAQQRVTDFHGLQVAAVDLGSGSTRSIIEYFHTLAARTVTLGAALPAPTVTTLGGGSPPYKRLQADYTLPADYNTLTAFVYGDGTSSVTLSATLGYLGGTAVALALADYSALVGWDNSWAPAPASTGTWNLVGSGTNITTSACVENANLKSASESGAF